MYDGNTLTRPLSGALKLRYVILIKHCAFGAAGVLKQRLQVFHFWMKSKT